MLILLSLTKDSHIHNISYTLLSYLSYNEVYIINNICKKGEHCEIDLLTTVCNK